MCVSLCVSAVLCMWQGVTHFSPGSYQHMPGCHSVLPNLFMAGDWVVTGHGSFSQASAAWGHECVISHVSSLIIIWWRLWPLLVDQSPR